MENEVSNMDDFQLIKDRISKLHLRRDHNLYGMAHFDEDVGTYHIRAQEQNKMIKDELVFLGNLINVMIKKIEHSEDQTFSTLIEVMRNERI